MGASKMTLITADDLISLIKEAGKGCYLYSCDIPRAYRQLPLDPYDLLVFLCKSAQRYFVDVSLLFGLR